MVPENVVAFSHDPSASYPKPPFSPSEPYPEYPFDDVASTPNKVYNLIRSTFMRLGLDALGAEAFFDRYAISRANLTRPFPCP